MRVRSRRRSSLPSRALIAWAAVFAFAASPARAESIIRNPGDHRDYAVEAEPHLAAEPWGRDTGIGPGFRGTFVLLHNGFIPSINNSVGLGVGLDLLFYGDPCRGPGQNCPNVTDAVIPAVMQWNFFLSPEWSVFGEPGLALHLRSNAGDEVVLDPFVIQAGGRYHFTDAATLTLRLGTPTRYDSAVSVGVSFLL